MDMDLEQKAIMRLREAADTSERFYKAPLIVTTSGGKDSSVCVALAEKAGIDFEVMHNHTTVDAPETVYFIRHEFKRLEEKGVKCTVNYPHYKGERVICGASFRKSSCLRRDSSAIVAPFSKSAAVKAAT